MKHYIDPTTNDVYAYAVDGSDDAFIKPGLLPMSAAEVKAHINPPVTQEQQVQQFKNQVQAHLDATAQAAGYDDIKTAVTYADEPSVAKFQAEGKAFRVWRSKCWAYCYEQLALIQGGKRAQPTIPEHLAELPQLELPHD